MAEIVNGMPQNVSKPHVPKQHSYFPIHFDAFDTHQFGLYRPHVAFEGVPSDKFRYRSVSKTKSYTLKAPLMQDVIRKQAYFKVDLPAILPLNAEKIYTNPLQGDDVAVDVNCVVEDAFSKISNAVSGAFNLAWTEWSNNQDLTTLRALFVAHIFGELFYSRGSLLGSLGCHLWKQCSSTTSNGTITDFDGTFDNFISQFLSQCSSYNVNEFEVVIDGEPYVVVLVDNVPIQSTLSPISFRHFLDLIRCTSHWTFTNDLDLPDEVGSFVLNSCTIGFYYGEEVPLNIQRVLAYQLACAEFFTNDKIDFIYSAELYRQFIGDLLRDCIVTFDSDAFWPQNFVYNGVNYQYDYLSGHYLTYILNSVISNPLRVISRAYNAYFSCLQYFLSIFGLQRSLRFKDYFVGSRAYPLAVGDVNVNVVSNQVNIVDVSRKIQVQRYLNAVNHIGRRLSNYIKALFGVEIQQDRHVPHYLAELTEMVYTSEVENTGDAQQTEAQSVTAVFTANSSNKEIEVFVDVPCVIIGITSYDIARAYTATIDRNFFIKDRFDMFIPEMQFIGDQPVYNHELDSRSPSNFGVAFGYQYRDMQYKQSFNRASGAFANDKLPGYSFVEPSFGKLAVYISPDFIRSCPSELDKFYLALSGWSLGNYFHFIVFEKNILDAYRPMVANPEILG